MSGLRPRRELRGIKVFHSLGSSLSTCRWWRLIHRVIGEGEPVRMFSVKKLIEQGLDGHPADDDEKVPTAWTVAVLDDCEGCGDLRVELVLEEVGQAGYGQSAHLTPEAVRRLRAALERALGEIGLPP
jgi:hypothetical protein